MGKRFLVVWENPHVPTEFHLLRTKEKAQAKVKELIGGYILDCITDNDPDNAIEFINGLKEVTEIGVYGVDDVYIEELDEED